jgi:hypothetical protein
MCLPAYNYEGRRVGTSLAGDPGASGFSQGMSFKLFGRYWKKWFDKRMGGKIYGPPKWTKPGPETNPVSVQPTPSAKSAKA